MRQDAMPTPLFRPIGQKRGGIPAISGASSVLKVVASLVLWCERPDGLECRCLNGLSTLSAGACVSTLVGNPVARIHDPMLGTIPMETDRPAVAELAVA